MPTAEVSQSSLNPIARSLLEQSARFDVGDVETPGDVTACRVEGRQAAKRVSVVLQRQHVVGTSLLHPPQAVKRHAAKVVRLGIRLIDFERRQQLPLRLLEALLLERRDPGPEVLGEAGGGRRFEIRSVDRHVGISSP